MVVLVRDGRRAKPGARTACAVAVVGPGGPRAPLGHKQDRAVSRTGL